MATPVGSVEVALSVFGGNNLDMGETDIPSGLSPGCADVAFLPGQFYTRPPLERFSSLNTTVQIVYKSTYIKPDGSVSQFEADSNGAMYFDGVKVGQTSAHSRFSTCNAFGKMYIAASDGLHGSDVPLQWNGQFLDRVSQDGPGAGPALANYSLPQLSLVTGTSGAAIAITTIIPINPVTVQVGSTPSYPYNYNPPTYQTYYSALQVTTGAPHGLTAGQSITIAGNSLYNRTGYVQTTPTTTTLTIAGYFQTNTTGTGGTVNPSAPFLQRSGNQVTASTSTPHQLRAGYQVVIAGVADQVIGGAVSSIVINNTKFPGEALVTTTTPHGLSPGEDVTLSGITDVAVGGGIATINVSSGIAYLTTNTAHGLQVGANITVQTSGGPVLPFVVSSVSSPTTLTYNDGLGSGTFTGGTIVQIWPGNENTSQLYQVQSVASLNSFFINIDYSNGTWNSGTLTYAWNGTFYVTSVPSTTTFVYEQQGPDLLLTSGSGTVSPQGQVAPGQRNAVCIFLTRTGYTTRPSPVVVAACGGNQYLLVTNIPIGPSNVVARIIAFTGANGGAYYYLPVAPRDPSGSYLIGTSTQINDNTTTSAIFDFTDEALFAAIAIGIPGNNLFNQQVLGPSLNFYSYASRLFSWGSRNRVQQYQNMGFEGGVLSTAPTIPLYWTVVGNGTLAPGDYGLGWLITGAGSGTDGMLTQPAYADQYGVPILQPLTQYTFNLWLKGGASVTMDFYSPTAGVLASAVVQATSAGGFASSLFSSMTPAVIPSDTLLRVYATGLAISQTVLIDELEQVYTANPYNLFSLVSYIENPEAFDGITGVLGPADDPQPIMGMTKNANADVLALLTFGPKGSLYIVEDTASGEPATWNIRHVSARCGLVSTWGIAEFEQWFIWGSDTGLRIYDGGAVDKLSQEVQSVWDSINPAARQFCIIRNDAVTRRVYLLLCTGSSTVTNTTYVMDYRELNSAGAISNSGTLHVSSYSGKIVTTDLTRKWSPWSITVNYCETLLLPTGESVMVFCGGNGLNLSGALFSATYTLDEIMIPGVATGANPGADGHNVGIDADYGPFWQNSTYPTFFFIGQDQAQQLELGAHRLLHEFMSVNATGVGKLAVFAYSNRLDNLSKTFRPLPLTANLARDLYLGLNVAGNRVAYRLSPSAASPSLPAGIQVSNLSVAMRTHPYSPINNNEGR